MTNNTSTTVWRKRHNLAAWILQILGCLAYLGLVIFTIIATISYTRSRYTAASYGIIIILIMAVLTIIFDIIEIVYFAKRKLSPVLILVFSSIKTTMWAIYMILIIVSAVITTGAIGLAIELPIIVVILATAVSQLVISAKFVRQGSAGYEPDMAVPKHQV